MRWGPHLRGGPRLQFTSLGQETGKGSQRKPREKKKKDREKQNTDTQTGRTKGMPREAEKQKTSANVLTGRGPARRGRDVHGGMGKGGAGGDRPGQRRSAAASGFRTQKPKA